MSFYYGDTKGALDNRKHFLAKLGIDFQNLVCARQIHGSAVKYVLKEDRDRGALSYDTSIPDTDALITDKRNLPLAVFTADCLPIFLYDSKMPAIGLVHAGWRSTQENIIARIVDLMKEKFNTPIGKLMVGFGPGIRRCCYEVEKKFIDFFSFSLMEKNNRYYLDLVGINKKQLLDLGVDHLNIFDSGVCTSCQNENFFSYRKEGKNCGRMMSVLMLK
jgi:hypothetical protein